MADIRNSDKANITYAELNEIVCLGTSGELRNILRSEFESKFPGGGPGGGQITRTRQTITANGTASYTLGSSDSVFFVTVDGVVVLPPESGGSALSWSQAGTTLNFSSTVSAGPQTPDDIVVYQIVSSGTDTSKPTLVGASVEAAEVRKIVHTFNELLDPASVPGTTAFTASGSVSGSKTATAVVVSASTVTVTYNADFVTGDVITSTYTKPGTNALQDLASTPNQVDTFTGQAVTNNIGSFLPTDITTGQAWINPSNLSGGIPVDEYGNYALSASPGNTAPIVSSNRMQFDGTAKALDFDSTITLSLTGVICMVIDNNAAAGTVRAALGYSINNSHLIGVNTAQRILARPVVTTNIAQHEDIINTLQILTIRRTTGDQWQLRIGLGEWINLYVNASNSQWNRIGLSDTAGQNWNGQIGDIFIANSASDTEINNVINYFATKHSITVTDTLAPTVVSAEVGTIDASTVAITMSEPLDGSVATTPGQFTIAGVASTPVVNSITHNGDQLLLNLSAAVVTGDTSPTFSYTVPGSNQVRDYYNNQLGTVTTQAITNNVAAFVPTDLTNIRGWWNVSNLDVNSLPTDEHLANALAAVSTLAKPATPFTGNLMDFTGGEGLVMTTAINWNTGVDAYGAVAVSSDDADSSVRAFLGDTSSSSYLFGVSGLNKIIERPLTTTVATRDESTIATTKIYSWRRNNLNEWYGKLNGAAEVLLYTAAGLSRFDRIGVSNNVAQTWDGKIGDLVLADATTSGERTNTENFLITKYGL